MPCGARKRTKCLTEWSGCHGRTRVTLESSLVSIFVCLFYWHELATLTSSSTEELGTWFASSDRCLLWSAPYLTGKMGFLTRLKLLPHPPPFIPPKLKCLSSRDSAAPHSPNIFSPPSSTICLCRQSIVFPRFQKHGGRK